jgi:energy-coupling factor transporter transmembrane protein EcfT
MNEEKVYKRFFWAFTTFVLMMGVALFSISCKTEYIPVETSHTEHLWHTDSVKEVDSVIHEKQTTIMQLDSAAMAQYGIQLKNAERAWLVKSWELERQIENLQRLTAIRDTIRDTISVPYPVEKKLSKWQQAKVDWGGWAMLGVLVVIILFLFIIPRWKGKRGV